MNRKSTAPSPHRRAVRPQPQEAVAAGNADGLEHRDLGSAVPNGQLRQQMVAEAAYFRALCRGFDGGDPDADWFAAEHEIDERLVNGP